MDVNSVSSFKTSKEKVLISGIPQIRFPKDAFRKMPIASSSGESNNTDIYH